MNDVHKFVDESGLRYDPGARASLAAFTADGDIAPLETAAALRSAWQAVDRLRSRGSGGRGLSTAALDVLTRLGTAPDGLSIGDLARACGVTSRNVTGLVDTLERDGLADRTTDPHDRRSVRVRATAAGRDWLESFRAPTQRAMAAVFRGFTPDELAQLRDLCLRVVDNQRHLEHYLNSTPENDRDQP
ncbi:MarR family winged helix-turn-helix transcriptional regulator [Nocardia stercoris]|uniref:MarR family transcriptional regulator n=1 Tax=Nocardia stercoris TaxID=2483361 RepID=A0A3M2L9P1_9NOCA|nr:MarR family transcriptional regulator [Nocardia stercoris]RMI34319.1 MarR family transcriptional regulator [Nocardia stercoris]